MVELNANAIFDHAIGLRKKNKLHLPFIALRSDTNFTRCGNVNPRVIL